MSYFRFHRRLRLLPGHSSLWANVSKSGVSVSAHVPGATFNSSGRRTVSLPGTGLSYVDTRPMAIGRQKRRVRPLVWMWLAVALLVYFTFK